MFKINHISSQEFLRRLLWINSQYESCKEFTPSSPQQGNTASLFSRYFIFKCMTSCEPWEDMTSLFPTSMCGRGEVFYLLLCLGFFLFFQKGSCLATRSPYPGFLGHSVSTHRLISRLNSLPRKWLADYQPVSNINIHSFLLFYGEDVFLILAFAFHTTLRSDTCLRQWNHLRVNLFSVFPSVVLQAHDMWALLHPMLLASRVKPSRDVCTDILHEWQLPLFRSP